VGGFSRRLPGSAVRPSSPSPPRPATPARTTKMRQPTSLAGMTPQAARRTTCSPRSTPLSPGSSGRRYRTATT